MKWFKHDSNANIDAKLRKLRVRYGMEGYGMYWYCLELIAGSVEKHNLTFELEHDAEVISVDTGIHQEQVQEMMSFMVDIGLFENDRGIITCLKMASRTDEYTQKVIKSLGSVGRVSGQNPEKSVLIEEKRREEKRKDKDAEASSVISASGDPPRNPCPYNKIITTYHERLPELRRVIDITKTRRAHMRQRWGDGLPTIESWGKYFDAVSASDFLMGRKNPGRNRTQAFQVDFDWLIMPSNVIKVLEGKYHD